MKTIDGKKNRRQKASSFGLLRFVLCAAPMLLASASSFGSNDESTPETNSSLIPNITWQPCDASGTTAFECAVASLPLNHSQPDNGELIDVALARLPATDQANKIGTIFLNPGGPGGSGVSFLLNAGPVLFNAEVREKFDLLGFDPRGIGASTPLVCFENFDQLLRYLDAPGVPSLFDDIKVKQNADKHYAELCRKNAGEIKRFMATADVAQDMDLLRQAVGDEKLNFAGYSYGSYLGVTYANMFPNNIRALLVDGVLDPVAWATGRGGEQHYLPVTTRLKSDVGAMATLNEFFQLCDAGNDTCVFSGNSAQRYATLAEQLKSGPLLLEFPDGSSFTLDYDTFIGFSLSYMYNSFGWSEFAELLLDIETFSTTQRLSNRLKTHLSPETVLVNRAIENTDMPQTVEGFDNVLCSDSNSPSRYFFWPLAAEAAELENGYFGPRWTWASSTCANWRSPSPSRYAGPFDQVTNQPILVASTLFDPATPYHGAETVRDLMPNSKLLSVAGWGHTTLFLSQCADEIIADYLLTGNLPEQDAICYQDVVPFASSQRQTLTTTDTAIKREIALREVTKNLR